MCIWNRSQGGQLRKCSRIVVCRTGRKIYIGSTEKRRVLCTYEEQEDSEADNEEQRPSQVCIIHDSLVDTTDGVEDSQ